MLGVRQPEALPITITITIMMIIKVWRRASMIVVVEEVEALEVVLVGCRWRLLVQ